MARAKKIFGQHFLWDGQVVQNILDSLPEREAQTQYLEVGPGRGVLTGHLLEKYEAQFWAIEVDNDLIEPLQNQFPELGGHLLHLNFLKLNIEEHFTGPLVVVGNFPYNISSQIIFKCLDHKDRVPVIVGMFQKEMAKRIVADPGSKDYGVISVLAQAYYNTKYLFEVPPTAFRPPPKVDSAVIRLDRNDTTDLGCDPVKFKQVVKLAFNQRRKMMRNSLKGMVQDPALFEHPFFIRRPETLSVTEFVELTNLIHL